METENQQKFTKTANGATAYTLDSFSIDEKHALAGINNSIITKDDFKIAEKFLDKIFKGSNKMSKVYAFILIFHIRDIEFGKGLRLPFYESLMYLYKNGYKELVKTCIPQIPTHGYFKDLCQLYMYAVKAEATDLQQIISDVYSKELYREFHLGKGNNKMTNCAKYAPRQQKQFKHFALRLSQDMFPESKTPQKDYRKFLQEIMSKYKQVTEVLMTANRWDEIDPKFIPSLCFQENKDIFLNTKTDNNKIFLCDNKPTKRISYEQDQLSKEENIQIKYYQNNKASDFKKYQMRRKFENFTKNALNKKYGSKIRAKKLHVNKIIEQFFITLKGIRYLRNFRKKGQNGIKYYSLKSLRKNIQIKKLKIKEDVLEAQMMDIVDDLKKNGKILDSCVAVCDVSGSMRGTPMYACIGLGLIINQLNKGNYSNKLITFHDQPSWIKLRNGLTYKKQVEKMANAPWGRSTNFYKTMKMIADLTDDKDKLPKIVFVFSDMQFNSANKQRSQSWENDTYKEIEYYYHQKGFTSEDIPIIVFWNLKQNGVQSFTVDCNQKGVICIAGFSQNLLKTITCASNLSELKNLNPNTFLINTLDNERYAKIKEIAQKNLK